MNLLIGTESGVEAGLQGRKNEAKGDEKGVKPRRSGIHLDRQGPETNGDREHRRGVNCGQAEEDLQHRYRVCGPQGGGEEEGRWEER